MIAIVLMFIGYRVSSFGKIRSDLDILAVPVQYLVSWPIEFFHRVTDSFATQQGLLAENAKLRAEQLLLQAKLQKLLALKQENAQLRELLSSSYHVNDKVVVAEILAVALNPFSQQVILNQGGRHGVYVGQPVLDANGVMGEIVLVDRYTSQVLLITDTRSAIPVEDNRNGLRMIAAGTGDTDQLELLYVPDTADVKVGDLIVTSGLGQHFPFGYPVGTVLSVKHNVGERFAKIMVKPSAHVNRSRQVLLVWHHSPLPKNQAKHLSRTSKKRKG